MATPSQIFAGDPNHPGAGYVKFDRQLGAGIRTYRIAWDANQSETLSVSADGTTTINAAQVPHPVAGARFMIFDGDDTVTGPLIDPQSYIDWMTSYHGPDVPNSPYPPSPLPEPGDAPSASVPPTTPSPAVVELAAHVDAGAVHVVATTPEHEAWYQKLLDLVKKIF